MLHNPKTIDTGLLVIVEKCVYRNSLYITLLGDLKGVGATAMAMHRPILPIHIYIYIYIYIEIYIYLSIYIERYVYTCTRIMFITLILYYNDFMLTIMSYYNGQLLQKH